MKVTRSMLAALALLLCAFLTGCGKDVSIPNVPIIATTASGNWYIYGQYQPTPGSPFNSGEIFFGGSLTQTDSQVSGVLHIDSPCFGNNATDIPYTGTLINNNLNLTSSAVSGQTLTLQGTLSQDDSVLSTASFEITGGCSVNLYSPPLTYTVNSNLNLKGQRIPSLTGSWTTTTDSSGLSLTEQLIQSPTPDIHGDFALSGTVAVQGSTCFTSGTLQPASFISGASGQQIILMNDGSTLKATLQLVPQSTDPKPVMTLYPGNVTGGHCNGPVDISLH